MRCSRGPSSFSYQNTIFELLNAGGTKYLIGLDSTTSSKRLSLKLLCRTIVEANRF